MKRDPLRFALVSVSVAVALFLVGAIIYVLTYSPPGASDAVDTGEVPVVRDNSHVLDDGGAEAVTVVEFLDFECEACGAFYPVVEELRQQYAGEITYVVRYFPIPSHFNSTNAALAAEAAAQQGRLEDMYHRLFQTQAEWGEAQDSRAELFRTFAEEIGLDMTAYDEAVADPATLSRVQLDAADGRALGVSSTPTFFVDGELVQLQSLTDLEDAITQALDAR